MNRAERRAQQKKGKQTPIYASQVPTTNTQTAQGRQGRVERGLVRHVSQQKGRGS